MRPTAISGTPDGLGAMSDTTKQYIGLGIVAILAFIVWKKR